MAVQLATSAFVTLPAGLSAAFLGDGHRFSGTPHSGTSAHPLRSRTLGLTLPVVQGIQTAFYEDTQVSTRLVIPASVPARYGFELSQHLHSEIASHQECYYGGAEDGGSRDE